MCDVTLGVEQDFYGDIDPETIFEEMGYVYSSVRVVFGYCNTVSITFFSEQESVVSVPWS